MRGFFAVIFFGFSLMAQLKLAKGLGIVWMVISFVMVIRKSL